MPELVRMYIKHCLIGMGLAVIFTALLIGLNVANLRYLVTHVSGGWLAVLMLIVFNTIVFSSVQFAFAVMRMAEKPDQPRGGNRAPAVARDAVAVPVAAGRPAR